MRGVSASQQKVIRLLRGMRSAINHEMEAIEIPPRGNFVIVVFSRKPTIEIVRRPKVWAIRFEVMKVCVHEHKFKVGQSASFTSGRFGRGGTNGIYTITHFLPPEGDHYQYRIKNANEPHERVVKESQMDRIA